MTSLNELKEQPLDPLFYSDTEYARDEGFRSVENRYWFDPTLNDSLDTSIDLFDEDIREQSGLDDFLL